MNTTAARTATGQTISFTGRDDRTVTGAITAQKRIKGGQMIRLQLRLANGSMVRHELPIGTPVTVA